MSELDKQARHVHLASRCCLHAHACRNRFSIIDAAGLLVHVSPKYGVGDNVDNSIVRTK
jgi:hypothetical protein